MLTYDDLSREELIEALNDSQNRLVEMEASKAELAKLLEKLQKSESEFRYLLEESSDPIFSFYSDGRYRYVNQAFADGVGMGIHEIIGNTIWDVFEKEEADKRFATVQWVFDYGETRVIEVRVPTPNGDSFYLTTVKPLKDDDGKVVSAICISKDITERKQLEKELQKLSTHDPLTGLFNRYFFEAELARFQVGRNFPVSIVVADMDNLKYVNDKYGHSAGDTLIRTVARVLRMTFRADDIIARSGGDEFVVLLPETEYTDAEAIVNRLRENILEQENILISLSVGIAVGRKGSYLPDVMRLADDRMYKEKASKIHKNRKHRWL
jgi:diguanylate cyclase (GGDEF)-like protein/PAS domain S-box-containing protein